MTASDIISGMKRLSSCSVISISTPPYTLSSQQGNSNDLFVGNLSQKMQELIVGIKKKIKN